MPACHHSCAQPPFPIAHVTPITDATTAFGIMAAAINRPLRAETICLLLRPDHTGAAFLVVANTDAPDHVIEVIEWLVSRRPAEIASVAIVSVRPGSTELLVDDVERWTQIDEITRDAGIDLLEWVVVGSLVMQPRLAAGLPSRWPADR